MPMKELWNLGCSPCKTMVGQRNLAAARSWVMQVKSIGTSKLPVNGKVNGYVATCWTCDGLPTHLKDAAPTLKDKLV